MEEAPENGKESLYSANTNGMNYWPTERILIKTVYFYSKSNSNWLLSSSGLLHWVAKLLIPEVLKKHTSFVFKG